MNQTVIIVAAVILVIALLLVLLVRGRKQHVTFSDTTALPRAQGTTPAMPASPARPAPPPAATPTDPAVAPSDHAEGDGVGDEVTAAIEDVIDQFIGIDAHPSGQPVKLAGAATDTLTRLKGLGPKAATRLAELGVTHFEQIASWDEQEVATIDAQMGSFKGRILRDRWVEQAKLLAAGDIAGFEEKFGKLGN